MIRKDKVTVAAETVLGYCGTVEQADAARIWTVFEDEKVRIEGVWFLDYVQRPGYEVVAVRLRLPFAESAFIPYEFPRGPSDTGALVYFWHEVTRYLRDGLWLTYLTNLAARVERQADEAGEHNGLPIDDSALFSDLADE